MRHYTGEGHERVHTVTPGGGYTADPTEADPMESVESYDHIGIWRYPRICRNIP